jgi:hypothetical protein
MPFATMQDIIDALPGQNVGFQKAFTTAGGGAGVWWSAWGGTTPSSGLAGAVVSDADTGAIPFANANAGNHLHIGRAQVGAGSTTTGVVSGVLSLYDRLWQNSGIDRTSTSAQTINSVALNRPDNTGFDVEAWWHVYVSMGTGTPTVTLTYTNADGTASRTGTAIFGASYTVGRTGPFSLQGGDEAVRSIQTWQGSATFGTAGTIGLVLRRRLMMLPINIGYGIKHDTVEPTECGLPRVYDDAFLECVVQSLGSTSTISPSGILSLIEG